MKQILENNSNTNSTCWLKLALAIILQCISDIESSNGNPLKDMEWLFTTGEDWLDMILISTKVGEKYPTVKSFLLDQIPNMVGEK